MKKKANDLAKELFEQYKRLTNIRDNLGATDYMPAKYKQPKYKLFMDEKEVERYTALGKEIKESIQAHEKVLKQVLDVEMGGSTVRQELNKMAVMLALTGKAGSAGLGKDWHIEKMRNLGIKKTKK